MRDIFIVLGIIGVFFLIGLTFFAFNRTVAVIDTGIVRYEEFYEIKHTADRINTDLCQVRELPEKDPMFAQFSKVQRINALQLQLNRWVEEYNAKSRMINRNLWKSSTLPYQLTTKEFTCY